MREILLEIETTGESSQEGHRLIEIACIEIFDKRTIGGQYHSYINPEMEISHESVAIHGITTQFLLDKPTFSQVADGLQGFLGGANLIAHHVSFDTGFLDSEFMRLGREPVTANRQIIDILEIARERFPGQKNSLDDLCERLGVSYVHRSSVGALLDADLLADIYVGLSSMINEDAVGGVM